MVKWHQYSGEVDYQYTVAFIMLPTKKIINIRLILLTLLTETLLTFLP